MRVRHWSVVFGVLPLLACAQPPATPAAATPNAGARESAPLVAKVAAGIPAKTAPPRPPVVAAVPEPRDAYTYQPAGRRDPFFSLVTTETRAAAPDPRKTTKRGEGLAGLSVNEIVVRGVMVSGPKAIAQIHGSDGRSYIIRPGDKLMDGTVTSINAQGLVIVQEVNDPLSAAKHREIRKLLRSLEDTK